MTGCWRTFWTCLIVNLHIQSVDQVSAIKTISADHHDLDRAKSRNKESGPQRL